ncbi:hypothetical protein POTOM_020580 [Populus tomentosa]|uniref:Pentatricopeptide repeat-containing protein n=1 Tax=Populus tomentosa TaxID=118781 RepID=A0A8X8D284_POPTO|nr:hypothetical protein POTOM_020580 [Populus tomentosa]
MLLSVITTRAGLCKRIVQLITQKALDIVIGEGCATNLRSYNNGYCKSRSKDDAKSLLVEMSEKELTADTVTKQGPCSVGRPREPPKLFNVMCSYGLLPDLITYSILLDGLFKNGRMFISGEHEFAKELFSKLSADGIRPTVRTYNVMIKGLPKEGLSDEAYELFRKMEDDGFLPDSSSYNAIIQGFLQNQDSSTAIRLVDEMVSKRFSADLYTFQMLLDLESHDEIISVFMRVGALKVGK